MALSSKERSALKAQAHHLKPVVRLGQHGLTEGVINETNISLDVHELIKIHIHNAERDDRRAVAEALCKATNAECVGSIGKVFILYRAKEADKA
jgi:RNA-binding protein